MAGNTTKRGSAPKRRTAAKPTTSRPISGRKVKRLTSTKTKSAPQSKRATTAKKTSKPKPGAKPQKPKKQAVSNTGTRAKDKAHTTSVGDIVAPTTMQSVTFTLDAHSGYPTAIAGTFTNWEPHAMIKGHDDLWRITLQLAPGRHQYRFRIGSEWREDPNNQRKVLNDQGGYNSICDVM